MSQVTERMDVRMREFTLEVVYNVVKAVMMVPVKDHRGFELKVVSHQSRSSPIFIYSIKYYTQQ